MTAPTLADEIAALRVVIADLEVFRIGVDRNDANREVRLRTVDRKLSALRSALARLEAMRWRPIAEAVEFSKQNDGWIPASLFAIKRAWGWEQWVGQCDAGDIWLGRSGDGSCFETEPPTHWQPLPEVLPEPQEGG